MGAVPSSVPQAVVSSTANSVPVLTQPQLGPRISPSGSERIPVVPRSDDLNGQNVNPQPRYMSEAETGRPPGADIPGAPSVPAIGVNGLIFVEPAIDAHYASEAESYNPNYRVNQPKTRGMFTFLKTFQNYFAQTAQNVDANGFRINEPQQRTSYMRAALPPRGIGFAPATSAPVQMPQRDNTYKYMPSTGTDSYGTPGVLNSSTYGAGQTAGGIGGNNYTPTPGPPPTNSTAGAPANLSGMPTWG